MRPGVENTSDGRCVASVLRMIMLGEGVVLHLAEQVQAVEPLQVVEAVAVLQFSIWTSKTKLKVEPSMPPNGMISSARPPIHRSTLFEAAQRAAGIGAGGVEEVDGDRPGPQGRRPTRR